MKKLNEKGLELITLIIILAIFFIGLLISTIMISKFRRNEADVYTIVEPEYIEEDYYN